MIYSKSTRAHTKGFSAEKVLNHRSYHVPSHYLAAESFEVAFGGQVKGAALHAVAKLAPAVLQPERLHGHEVGGGNELHFRPVHVLAPARLSKSAV